MRQALAEPGRWLGLGVLALAVILMLWWYGAQEEFTELESRAGRIPDYTVAGLHLVTMNELGRPSREMTAVEMRHYPQDDSTELERPQLIMRGQDRPLWTLDAQSGWLSADARLMLLKGEVKLVKEQPGATSPLVVDTRDVRVLPEDEYAETEQPVLARSGPDWLEAKGMQAWFKHPIRIKMLAHVRGRYDLDEQP